MSSFVCTSRRKFPRTFKEPHKTFSPTAGLPFPDPEAIYGQAGLQKTWVSTLITFPKHWDVQMFESIALKCKRWSEASNFYKPIIQPKASEAPKYV
jgi:hypothetical protein